MTRSPAPGPAAAPNRLRRRLTSSWAAADAAEAARSAGRYTGPAADLVGWREGHVPLLVTAPHAVAHQREGHRKPADVGTGFVADLLAGVLDAHLLTAEGHQSRDGNWDPDGAFKDELAAVLPRARWVVDVHGMSDRYDVDVCLGAGPRPELAAVFLGPLTDALTARGFTVAVNDPFPATRTHTVTATAQRAGTAAVQVELAARVRRPHGSLDLRGEVVSALVEGLSAVVG